MLPITGLGESDCSMSNAEQGSTGRVHVTIHGLPLTIALEWPFHGSTSGADFHVLHGDVRLENSGGLHALVAVQLTLTVAEVMPSLEPADAEAPLINCLRKETDRKQLEFVKSPKRLPVPFNSRTYDFKRNRWAFVEATDEQISTLLRRKVYWEAQLNSRPAWIADPADAQYLNTSTAHLLEIAQSMPDLLSVSGDRATATPVLLARGEQMEDVRRAALAELEKKHAFERA